MAKGSAIFLDTSVQIARMFHTPQKRRKIGERIKNYDISVTSLVVRQEFKRRVLREAQYLLNQLQKYDSFDDVFSHVLNVLPAQSGRKRTIALNICLAMLPEVYPDSDDREKAERAKRLLRTLLRTGLTEFDGSVDHVVRDSGCACSKYPIREIKAYRRYDFGPDRCSGTDSSSCGIVDFLVSRQRETQQILGHLRELPPENKSKELQSAELFIEKVLEDPALATRLDPCSRVGDLLIALESVGIPFFYTLNSKESQHLCRALGQSLVFRPNDPEKDDVVCDASDTEWPEF